MRDGIRYINLAASETTAPEIRLFTDSAWAIRWAG